ncbi:MAG: hypothetical protein EPN82_03065 [Bacteroidetes bacterium]|nr:MAG: hypothetical protein EPN82_03065 [Bacteroidota bacterium]
MSWELVPSSSFENAKKKYLKYYPQFKQELENSFKILSDDPFNPKLKTHKLKGTLEGSLSCRINYSLRLIFSFNYIFDEKGNKKEIILLETLETHDEVY